MKKGDISAFSRRTKRNALCWGDGTRKEMAQKKEVGVPMLLTCNEMHQPRDALLLTPQGSVTELNLSLD
ncbi:UNVERIFIED_CONTAM: hypothetical protein Sradi_6555100 [Sesamum radiatum]|uniref:Uncharacterized protein n=1 Tax=Sesamum radiatum TaxID=300843 RepID=A0AAW2JXN9_SESRA